MSDTLVDPVPAPAEAEPPAPGLPETGTARSGASAERRPPSPVRRSRLLLWAAAGPLALLAVLVMHVGLRVSSDLTAWKGGGFGMFSTVDSPGTRLLRVELRGENGTFLVAPPETYKQMDLETRVVPSADRLHRMATALAGELWAIPRLPGGEGDRRTAEDRAMDDLAMQTMAQLMPVEAVKAVPKEAFDPKTQRRIRVAEVEVSVWKLEAVDDDRPTGGGTVTPRLMRSVVVKSQIGNVR